MFSKILIANRGEIARRLVRAAHILGVSCAAVYSEADQHGVWAREADEAYPLPGVTAADTYLNQEAILEIALRAGAEAIHPGYGFLSENAGFAQACAEAGLTFIGPDPKAIREMGSKARSRELAEAAGVPVIPGVDGGGKSLAELTDAGQEIGYPLLIKASAGGGGKGMRIVWSPDELADAIQAARSESRSAFGSDHLLLEKYFTEIHHVEVQVLGDRYGHLIHLFERECSIQRRHQKIIEETPSPNVAPALRQEITAAAAALAKAVDYVSAGTVEFVVDGQGRFYLLEMNTRLQVEHPVTEWVTGIDLAAWQIRIAAGERLTIAQEDVVQRGHALECRLYAEDPAQNFIPSIGEIVCYRPPAGPGIRVDDGIETGFSVSSYYDPMLAKLITWGQDRREAVDRMIYALQETLLLGITSNLPYLLAILQSEPFREGDTTTNFLEQHLSNWSPPAALDDETWLAIAALEAAQGSPTRSRPDAGGQPHFDPWRELAGWRNHP